MRSEADELTLLTLQSQGVAQRMRHDPEDRAKGRRLSGFSAQASSSLRRYVSCLTARSHCGGVDQPGIVQISELVGLPSACSRLRTGGARAY